MKNTQIIFRIKSGCDSVMAGLSVPTTRFGASRRKRRSIAADTLDKTGYAITELLEKCYLEDYVRKEKELAEDSGWRSLVFISRTLRIPLSRVYGDDPREHFFSETLETLLGSRKLEYRVFQAERGRGGRIVKVRAKRP